MGELKWIGVTRSQAIFVMRVSLCLCVLVVVVVTLVNGQTPSYTFPARYQSAVGGWVSDGLSGHKKIISTGWMYTDNTLPAMRVDEVWDLETTAGTALYQQMGVLSDTHLYYDTGSLFIYTNTQGAFCSNASAAIPPQDWPASTYVGKVDFEGHAAYLFNQSYGHLPSSLYVDIESGLPLANFIGPASNRPGRFWDGAMVYFRNIIEVASFNASSVLFTMPSFCTLA